MTDAPKPLTLTEALRAARETRALEIGPGILDHTPRVFREQFGERPAVIVTDANTLAVAGDAVTVAFRAANHPLLETFVFRAPDLSAEHRFVVELETSLRRHEAIPIAVGAGTLNDLCKLAAHRAGRPYLCVATAASMDGYTAFGASITHLGSKQTFLCPAPVAVLADLTIICNSPAEMSAWGYADLLSKITAGADWIVADALGAEPMEPQAWNMVQGRLRELVADPAGICARRPAAIGRLVEGLMLSGFAMQAAKSSRPASGAEHQFSHLWDMQQHTHNGWPPPHGFKVGIGTLAVAALYEQLLAQPFEQLDVERRVAAWPGAEAWIQRATGLLGEGELSEWAAKELRAKQSSPAQLRAQLETLRRTWLALRAKVRTQLLPLATLRRMLHDAGAPTAPEQIGISRERLRQSYWQAFCIRRRFTVIDLAARTGLLDECVDRVLGPGGGWPIEEGKPTGTATKA